MSNQISKDLQKLQTTYQSDGVTLIPKAINDHWQSVLKEAIEIQVAKGIRYFANRNMRAEPGGFQDFCLHSSIGKLVGELVGSSFTSPIFDQMFVKEVDTKTRTGWHTDQPYWPIEGPIMTTWIALDFVDADNGAFKEYLKPDDPQYSDIPDFEAQRDQHRILSFDMEPGDLLAFDGYIVHSACGNRTSTRWRRGYAMRFATDGAVYKPDQGVAPWLEDETISPGDRFTSAKFPTIYERA